MEGPVKPFGRNELKGDGTRWTTLWRNVPAGHWEDPADGREERCGAAREARGHRTRFDSDSGESACQALTEDEPPRMTPMPRDPADPLGRYRVTGSVNRLPDSTPPNIRKPRKRLKRVSIERIVNEHGASADGPGVEEAPVT